MLIWLTNFLIFGLWYWEIDRGGPGQRAAGHDGAPDFLFPQMTDDRIEPRDWRPSFIDYLYVSLTNATAFSPTDTMPLTPMAKSVMGVQSLVSLVTIGLIVSRAVNILTDRLYARTRGARRGTSCSTAHRTRLERERLRDQRLHVPAGPER